MEGKNQSRKEHTIDYRRRRSATESTHLYKHGVQRRDDHQQDREREQVVAASRRQPVTPCLIHRRRDLPTKHLRASRLDDIVRRVFVYPQGNRYTEPSP